MPEAVVAMAAGAALAGVVPAASRILAAIALGATVIAPFHRLVLV